MGSNSMPGSARRVKRSRTSVYGHRRIKGVDMRSAPGRRFRTLLEDLSRDLGGFDQLSAAERSLVRHSACLLIEAESVQGRIMRGETDVNPDEIIRLSSETRRCLQGIKRRKRT